MKRIVTIQDLSCIGKCALTVALPVISAMGIETAVIPTAVLSAHTAFDKFTIHDLTNEIIPVKNDLKEKNIHFDAIYTGYLASKKQISIVSEFIDEIKNENTLTIIDPAMADNGRLYTGFDENFAPCMTELCKKADILLPNVTESALILKKDYIESGCYNEDYIKDMLIDLCALGAKQVVITGVSFDNKKIGVMGYDSQRDKFYSYFKNKIERIFHGTGDVFASCYCGCALNGFSTEESIKTAVEFTNKSIEETLNDENPIWYGVHFEKALPYLINKIRKNK